MGSLHPLCRYAAACIASCVAALALADPVPCDKNHYILEQPCSVPGPQMPIGAVGAVATDALGSVYFSSPNIVYKMNAAGEVFRFAGNTQAGYAGDGGPATAALLNFPESYPELEAYPSEYLPLVGGLAPSADGALYIADAYNDAIRKVDAAGTISTVTRPGHWPLSILPLRWPEGVAVDGAGTLYIVDGTGAMLRLDAEGKLDWVIQNNCGHSGTPGLCAPKGIAVDAQGNAFASDNSCKVRKVTPTGGVVTVAGGGRYNRRTGSSCGYAGDGEEAPRAALNGPAGVAVGADGTLYIADTYNHCIRKVDRAGVISTVAGVCGYLERGFSGDEGLATKARLDLPFGVAVNRDGDLYIADMGNKRVRRVARDDGVIVTVAGNGR